MKSVLAFIGKHQNIFMAIAYFGIIWPLYVVINHFELHEQFKKHILEIPLDNQIPFAPIWVFPYASMYAIVILPFLYVREQTIYRHMFYSFCLTGIIAYIVFLVFPTFDIMRPIRQPLDFDSFMLAMDNKHDSPYNCFPSLHVGFSMTAGLWSYYVDRSKVGSFILLWAIMVSVSVLFVKEHYIADLIGGTVLSGSLFYLFSRGLKSKPLSPRKEWLHSRRWLLLPILFFAAEVLYVLIKYGERAKEALWF